MRNPMIDCMAREWIIEFMSNGVDFTVDDVINALPLDHFELNESEKDELDYYVSDMADYLTDIWDYELNEDGKYVPTYNDDDKECLCDECRAKLAKERAEQEDDECDGYCDECERDEDEDTVINTSSDKGLLTIPARFVREIADSGEEMMYATFGNRVEVFPTSNKKLMKSIRKADGLIDLFTYTPHYTHGYFEVRRTMNGLIEDLYDASNTDFEITLDRDAEKIIVREA